ncbi:MAG: phytase [Saprospiraceae bacterium]|nr:phytase [Saprospiraceae bacterium]
MYKVKWRILVLCLSLQLIEHLNHIDARNNVMDRIELVINLFADTLKISPVLLTETVLDDTDDPAIWINKKCKNKSLILGTDKNDNNGGIYVYDLKGKINRNKTITGVKRPNNIDVTYGFNFANKKIDIATFTERGLNRIRIISLPDCKFIDGGGIEVFKNESEREPMGIAFYKNIQNGKIYIIVGRKSGPSENYLEQYELYHNNTDTIKSKLIRKFGTFSGIKEIESIAVDDELGFVYYSDEQYGIRKYYADPEKGAEELAVFGRGEFKEDNEGISIRKFKNGKGYILVSDQSANQFNVYPREGQITNPHQHSLICRIPLRTLESDGSDITSISLPGFKGGLFVAMSTDKTFHYYRWKDMAKSYGLRY